MAVEIVCPACESDEHLSGTPLDDGTIELTCADCKVKWTRDPRPRCPQCGGDDLYHVPQVIMEKSRGTQMSIQGVHREFLCRECDADQIGAKRDVHLPQRLRGSQ